MGPELGFLEGELMNFYYSGFNLLLIYLLFLFVFRIEFVEVVVAVVVTIFHRC